MIKRYLTKRNNPWELLAIAALLFIPGLVMVFQRKPMIAFPDAYGRNVTPRFAIEIISPSVAHIFGLVAIAFSVMLVVLYFYVRSVIARDSTHVVEHGHDRI